jgi:hypothetical protein
MSMTIGSVTLANPAAEDYRRELVPIASDRRAADGTLRTDYAAMKHRWTVTAPALDSTERDSLETALAALAHLSWTPPEGGSYTVRVVEASWGAIAPATYACTFVVEEV